MGGGTEPPSLNFRVKENQEKTRAGKLTLLKLTYRTDSEEFSDNLRFFWNRVIL